jgi:proteasome lid subunit RPN8/RPN11
VLADTLSHVNRTGANLESPIDELRVTPAVVEAMAALALTEYPIEACGLMAGLPGSNLVTAFYPCRNIEQSARIYTIDPRDHLRAERDAEDKGLEIRGVMHSHTHSEAYPSSTDVQAAPDPDWHYLIVTLKREKPEMRTYRIRREGLDPGAVDEAIAEIPLTIDRF